MSIINKNNSARAEPSPNLPNDYSLLVRELTLYTIRKLVESALKVMIHSKSESLEFVHIAAAIKDLGISDLEPSPYLDSQKTGLFISQKEVIEESVECLSRFKPPSMQVRWVIIDDHVPRVQENNLVKRDHRQMQIQNSKQTFNIIHDMPANFLMPQENHLFRILSSRLEADKKLEIDGQWSLNNLLPFVMNVMMNLGPSQNRVRFLVQLVRSPLLNETMEFHIHKVMAFMLAYEGEDCWVVGLEMSRLICVWQFKYLQLHNVLDVANSKQSVSPSTYSFKIKRLAYEVYFRMPPALQLDSLEADIRNGVPQAQEFLQLLRMCWLRFDYPKCEYHRFYEDGKVGLHPDLYLQTMI